MSEAMINIAKDFSPVPAGRFREDGNYTGEHFREDVLKEALYHSDRVLVEVSGTKGYGSSFLEEAFGGLVRKGYFTAAELHNRLEVLASEQAYETYVQEIWEYIDSSAPEEGDLE